MAMLGVAGLSGCGGGADTPRVLTTGGDKVLRNEYDQNTGSVFGDSGANLLNLSGRGSTQPTAAGMTVNAYLWRGALETLKFMPLASADPFGGVIITDWWTPSASPGERFKATAYIQGQQLTADGVHISLFRQVQQNGQWVDAAVDPGKPTELENIALTKARGLRAQSGAAP